MLSLEMPWCGGGLIAAVADGFGRDVGFAGLKRIAAVLKFLVGRVDSVDPRRRRLLAIVQGVVTGLANRFVGILISLISVPLSIGYLGPERFGVWVLIGSLLAWARMADLGIGNGLTNSLASAFGAERSDLARTHVSTAFAVLSAIALTLGAAVLFAWPWLDWPHLFGVHSALARAEVGPAIAVAVVIFLLGFPLSIIGATYMAVQDGKIANYWGMAGNVASFLALVAVTRTEGGLIWLVIAVSGTNLAVNAISGLWLFTRRRPEMAPRLGSVRRESAKGLLHIGGQFFLIQIMALIVFETDNLVIAHYLGADSVPPYSLTYTLFGFTSIIQAILFKYVWVAYAEAIARRDIDWVRRIFAINLASSLGFTLATVVPLVFIARPFITVWAGAEMAPPGELLLWMAAWSMINAFCSPTACLLAAASRMSAQVVYSAAAAILNLALSVYLVQHWGIVGVIAATVISYAVFIVVPQGVDTFLALRRIRQAA